MLQAILGILTVITAGFSTVYVKDFRKNRDAGKKDVFGQGLVIGFITDFLDAIGLTGVKLIIGVVGNFILGALMTAGIGLYAPCMAMVGLLGMNPKAAFPIMIGACAFVGPIASTKFVKEGAYVREVSMGITIGGVVGSVLAILFVTNLPVYWLNWLVVAVVVYTSVTMFKSALSKNDEKELELQAS